MSQKKRQKKTKRQALIAKQNKRYHIEGKGEGASNETMGVSTWRLNRVEERNKGESTRAKKRRRLGFFRRQEEQKVEEELRRTQIKRRPREETEK